MELFGTHTNLTVRKTLLSYVKRTPESIFGGVPDLNIIKAILDAKHRSKWKELRHSSRCKPYRRTTDSKPYFGMIDYLPKSLD